MSDSYAGLPERGGVRVIVGTVGHSVHGDQSRLRSHSTGVVRGAPIRYCGDDNAGIRGGGDSLLAASVSRGLGDRSGWGDAHHRFIQRVPVRWRAGRNERSRGGTRGGEPDYGDGFSRIFLPDERISVLGLIGLLLGFVGVALVENLDPDNLLTSELVWPGLVSLAAASIAFGSVLVQRIGAGISTEGMVA